MLTKEEDLFELCNVGLSASFTLACDNGVIPLMVPPVSFLTREGVLAWCGDVDETSPTNDCVLECEDEAGKELLIDDLAIELLLVVFKS